MGNVISTHKANKKSFLSQIKYPEYDTAKTTLLTQINSKVICQLVRDIHLTLYENTRTKLMRRNGPIVL